MSLSSIDLLSANWLSLSPVEIASLTPLESVHWPPFADKGLRLSIKREDLLGYQLGGNKVYKLYGHLLKARQLYGEQVQLASFGGAWSNHLYALGAITQQLGIPVLAIVRGETGQHISAMLRDIQAQGVRLLYVTREEFRRLKSLAAAGDFNSLQSTFGDYYWIPEGGGGPEGARALAAVREAILAQSDSKVDVIAHACGTGTSLAGLVHGTDPAQAFLGVAVLKAGESLDEEVRKLQTLLGQKSPADSGESAAITWEIDKQSHCGGYAKLPAYLADFMHHFEEYTGIPLDPIYTAKLMYGLSHMAQAGKWQQGTHVVAIHSGGLQGRRGWPCFN